MTKILVFIFIGVASITLALGQESADSISMKKAFGGYQFFQGQKRLNMAQLVGAMKSNSEAYKKISSAKSDYTIANVLGFAGGMLIGWPLGTSLGGGDPNWAIAGVGAGLLVIAIPISNSSMKKAKDAIETYNGSLETTSFWENKELNLTGTTNGLGLVLKF